MFHGLDISSPRNTPLDISKLNTTQLNNEQKIRTKTKTNTKIKTGYIKVGHNSAVEEIMNKVTMTRTNFNTIQENKFAHNISVWSSIDQQYFLFQLGFLEFVSRLVVIPFSL